MTAAQAAAIREGQEEWLRDNAAWLVLHWYRDRRTDARQARLPAVGPGE
jgi:hypothetical protein